MTDATDPTESLAAALGRVASGEFVLTARRDGREAGRLMSWVQQCSFSPPQVTVAVNKAGDILELLPDGATFVLNVIPDDSKKLIVHFGKGFAPGAPAFEGLEVRRDGDSPPVLLAAHAFLRCVVASRVDVGDHVLLVGRVVAGGVLRDAEPATRARKNGLRY
jgi:flavin reductase (DIM6/NTAB) family NADH-FMN oxidoreductase RutF